MNVVGGLAGLLLIFAVLLDAFETIVLPRRVMRRLRITRLFYLISWWPWSALARRIRSVNRRENYLSFYGPLSLILLLALWAIFLILGFALLQFALGSRLNAPETHPTFFTYFYMSGVTFFTLGFGDVVPLKMMGRSISIAEAGVGFGFLGLVIGYLPVMYQAFSRRELNISLLDARAGSPPSAFELLRRYCQTDKGESLRAFLSEWERWSADILETHLSYPVLSYFRSMHENQSWLAAITTILDTCTLLLVGIDNIPPQTARLTFAMARHAAVDLSQTFGVNPATITNAERLPPADLVRLREILAANNIPLRTGPDADQKFAKLRQFYEPYVVGLSNYLVVPLPIWVPPMDLEDNWQRTAWQEPGNVSIF